MTAIVQVCAYLLLLQTLSTILGKIYNANRLHLHPFFCFDAIVVRERASWEEALEHCREIHSDLASVTSQTDMLLIQAELDKSPFTEHVWVGLRFFPGGWRWTDKEHDDIDTSDILGTNDTLVGVSLGRTDFWQESEWEVHDCEQRLYFVSTSKMFSK
uniref:C-type lectin domain-containing protein n=1 Tax=Hippocampus comes TaxID=109280 RepID=A0A3Q2XCV7_HIPCM